MLNKEKGITLIALIITIIVMLILVGVTINVALNGGLFDKAKDAAKAMEEKAMYEQIVMGIQLEDGKINIAETFNQAKEILKEYTIIPGESGTNYQVITVKGKNGTYTYTITDEKIIIGNEIPTPPEETSPVAGTYYQPNREISMTFDEYGNIVGPAEWGLGDGATYTYSGTDSTITASNGVVLEFHQLANNKILINESMNLFFSISRNGLEGQEIEGTYIDNNTGKELVIDSNEGTWKITKSSEGSSYMRTGQYVYFNNKIYSDYGSLWGTIDENNNIIEYDQNGYYVHKEEIEHLLFFDQKYYSRNTDYYFEYTLRRK